MKQCKELLEVVLGIKIESYFAALSDKTTFDLDKYYLNYIGSSISSITEIETRIRFFISPNTYITSIIINNNQ